MWQIGSLITLVALAALLLCEWRGWRRGTWIAKPVASVGFLIAAYPTALDTPFGRLMLSALALSWLGDVLLIPEHRGTFLAGLITFLLGHVAYVVAFTERGVNWNAAAVAVLALSMPGFWLSRWLGDRVPRGLRRPIRAYTIVITCMVSAAWGTFWNATHAPLLLGAVVFYLSDICVARERFVTQGFINKLWGLPLYYVGQLLLAYAAANP